MGKVKRKRYESEFKTSVALEATRSEQTLVELLAKHGIHQAIIAAWKRQANEGLAVSLRRGFQLPTIPSEPARWESQACVVEDAETFAICDSSVSVHWGRSRGWAIGRGHGWMPKSMAAISRISA